jgi:hypothetical protein
MPDQYPFYLKPIPITRGRKVQEELDALLEREVPGPAVDAFLAMRPAVQASDDPITYLVRWLYSSISAAEEPIKYQEIRNSIIRGEVDEEWVRQWELRYADYVNTALAPLWDRSAETGASLVEDGINAALATEDTGAFATASTQAMLEGWIKDRGAQWVTNATEQQMKAVNYLLQEFLVRHEASAEEMARYIRPAIDLTVSQTRAVEKYRQSLQSLEGADKLSDAKIENMVQNYYGRLHRFRALRIAKTESSFAYNRGMLASTNKAMQDGWFNNRKLYMVWILSGADNTCERCQDAADRGRVEWGETWEGGTTKEPNVPAPPLHPLCACSFNLETVRIPASQRVNL